MRRFSASLLLCSAFAGRGQASGRADRAEISRTARRWSEAGDCASCHTADPAKPFAGGKRIDTPFGAIYSPNLTPDRETGLGAWSDDGFLSARCAIGVAPDGSRYYPAFPYPNFTKLTRDDILSIRAYLATLDAVQQQGAAAASCAFPSTSACVMRVWNYLFFRPGIFEPDQTQERRLEPRPLSGRGGSAIAAPATRRRTSSAPTSAAALLRGGQVARLVRAAARRRRAQRAEIMERRRHRRISAERPQRQKAMPTA